MGACFDRLRCEVFQNLFLSPMNTGFVRYAVATVLTVYGIETTNNFVSADWGSKIVATVLTVYGIETHGLRTFLCNFQIPLQQYLPFTVLKHSEAKTPYVKYKGVATVLTVYGIETCVIHRKPELVLRCNSTYRLRY